MIRLSKFERKLAGAMVAVALAPLAGALVIGQVALLEVYQVGVRPSVRQQLERGLTLYHDQVVLLREDAERTADALAFDHRLVAALDSADRDAAESHLRQVLERYPDVISVTARPSNGSTSISVEEPRRAIGKRVLDHQREIPGWLLDIAIARPAGLVEEYQRAGEDVRAFTHLEANPGFYTSRYLVGYIAVLLLVILLALFVVTAVARRVTRRVGDLAMATQRVGRGDLSVEVPTDASDEVGELTRAFNTMVRDLRESRQRIEYLQRIGAWQEFARRLAHEIKNPLTPIQLAAQEVSESYRGDDPVFRHKLDEARSIIEEEVATLRRLVGEFSAFAKLPAVQLSDADLAEFVDELSKAVGTIRDEEAGQAEVEVVVQPASEPIPVRIDAMMLKRGVDNLVRNAVQAIRDSARARGRVVVAAYRDKGRAVLEVRDDGPGVPVELAEQVFDPYFTRKADGTGLGLAIVKKVVLEHGGEVRCEPSAEGGASFQIRLPLVGHVPRAPGARPRSNRSSTAG